MGNLPRFAPNVAHALVRAASRLVSTLAENAGTITVSMKALISLLSLAFLACPQSATDAEVTRIAALRGAPQTQALESLLAFPSSNFDQIRSVFHHEAELRPSLLALLSDPTVGDLARNLVALIGTQEDLQKMVGLGPTGKRAFENRWAYYVACSLVEPQSDEEWTFLRQAAMDDFGDRWVDAGSIQTLKLIASPQSRQILEEAQKINTFRAKSIARAFAYIDTHPAPLADRDLEQLAKRVAQAVAVGKWEGNKPPLFNQAGDKALIDISFRASEDAYIYTAIFHSVEGVWKFRGVRETLQAFLPPVHVVPVKPVPR